MDKARHKRNYDLHAWSGVTLGIFLYIVCFTGSVAVFALSETHIWEDPAQRIAMPDEPAPITDTFDAWYAEQSQLGEVELLGLSYPTPLNPFYYAYADIHVSGPGESDYTHEDEHAHDHDEHVHDHDEHAHEEGHAHDHDEHAHEGEHVHAWVEQRWHPETLAPLETRQASMS